MDLLLVFSTFPDEEKARQIGTLLVEKQLAACVNILPSVESVYCWQGKIENSRETLAIFKTTGTAFPAMRAELSTLHPYDVPEIVALEAAQASAAYAEWVMGEVTGGGMIKGSEKITAPSPLPGPASGRL